MFDQGDRRCGAFGNRVAEVPDRIVVEDMAVLELCSAGDRAAFDAFRTALEDRLKKEGKLTINNDALKRLSKTS